MRYAFYGIALVGAVLLWLLVKLEGRYRLTRAVVVRLPVGGGNEMPSPVVEMEVEGLGYALLLWRPPDTLPLGRVCASAVSIPEGLSVRWNLTAIRQMALCDQLRRVPYRPRLRWILPEGTDFVSPPTWLSDTVWSWGPDSLPPLEYSLVAKVGRHQYDIPLPPAWGLYPETLRVQAQVERFLLTEVEIAPKVVGVKGYLLLLRPSRVKLLFSVPASYAAQWYPSNFEVVVDMQKVLPGDTVVYPELRKKPSFVRDVQILPPALEFTRIY